MRDGSFGDALLELRLGRPVARASWNGAQRLELQLPDAQAKMTRPYFYLTSQALEGTRRIPWIPTHDDLLAQDWMTR